MVLEEEVVRPELDDTAVVVLPLRSTSASEP